MDETSTKGQNYVTVVADLEAHRVIYVTEGKDSTTVNRFVEDFQTHGGRPADIQRVTCDMALDFGKGINDNFKNSTTIIDKFHVIKHVNDAVDATRKTEVKSNSLLSRTKYIWLKNDENLPDRQRAHYSSCETREDAEPRMKKLCSWMMHSRLPEMKKFCGTLKSHWDEILNYFDNKYTNATLEGINSIIQNIKRRARGFRNEEYFKIMIWYVEIWIKTLL